MEFAATHVLTSPPVTANPNCLMVACSKFFDDVKSQQYQTGEPIICSGCKAYLNSISHVAAKTKIWRCEFCSKENNCGEEFNHQEMPKTASTTFFLEGPKSTTNTKTSTSDNNNNDSSDSCIIFCIGTNKVENMQIMNCFSFGEFT